MITLIIIVMIIWAVISACTPDKKNEKKVQEEIQRLPRINLRAKELSGFQKFMNLAYDESSILIDFTYDSGYVRLMMKNGNTLLAPLSETIVRFVKNSELITVTVEYKKMKISFYEMSKLYSDQE